MSPLDFLYITLSIAIWVLIFGLIATTVALFKFLDQLRITAKSIAGVTLSFEIIKNSLKLGVLRRARNLLNSVFFKGGDSNE